MSFILAKVDAVNYDTLSFPEKAALRDKYIKFQKGRCWYCKGKLSEAPINLKGKKLNLSLFPTDFLKYPIHLHHDHTTGLTVGATHSLCNGILAQYHHQ